VGVGVVGDFVSFPRDLARDMGQAPDVVAAHEKGSLSRRSVREVRADGASIRWARRQKVRAMARRVLGPRQNERSEQRRAAPANAQTITSTAAATMRK